VITNEPGNFHFYLGIGEFELEDDFSYYEFGNERLLFILSRELIILLNL